MANWVSEVVYMFTQSGTRKEKSFFIIRCGLVLIVSLALCVVASLYKQLRELSALFNEISEHRMIYNLKGTKRWRKDIAVYSPGYDIHFEKKVFDHRRSVENYRGNNSEFKATNTDFTSRFQDKLHMVRQSFYESVQGAENGPKKLFEIAQDSKMDDSSSVRGYQTVRAFGSKESASDPGSSRVTRMNVMIFAYHRSGSSFIGEMFNRNPEVFYLFEPVHPIQMFFGTRRKSPLLYDALVRQLLDTIYKCSFSKHPFFVNILSTSGFRLKSQLLASPTLCDPRVTSRKMHLCRRINATLLTTICRSSFHTVIKTIRISNWENLEFLTEPEQSDASSSLSFKLIHLVRDPRAIITSRVWWFLRNFTEIMKENGTIYDGNAAANPHAIVKYVRIMSVNLCGRIRNDIKNANKKMAIGKTYAMIRYEDVARRPLKAYQKIYEFAGISESEHVRKWLESNTMSIADPGYYSTTRNSTAAANMWRLRLPMTLVEEVQNQCSEVMGILGYKLVHNDEDLRNMSRSLVRNDEAIKWSEPIKWSESSKRAP